jgi:hypothetical protein
MPGMAPKVLKEVMERVERWPETRQDHAARVLLEMEEHDASPYGLTDEQVAEVVRRRADPKRTFLTLEEIRGRFDRRR